MKQEMMGWVAVTSAGLYTNSLHLAPDRWHTSMFQHLISHFLQAGSSC